MQREHILVNRMELDAANCKSRDILSRPWLAFALFWFPAIAIAVTGRSQFAGVWRTVVWTIALATMGTVCLVNARRCKRVHCYITGPFFLAMALATVSYGLGLLRIGRYGWSLISGTILIGAIALSCLPELFLGKYLKTTTDRSS